MNKNIIAEDLSIVDLVDINALAELFTKFTKLTGYTVGFVKQDTREVLISTGWTDICNIYHRGSDSSAYICQESNAELTKELNINKDISLKECRHGMIDGATPIIIDGEHLADLFSGQVLFNKPNLDNFAKGAQEFGYDLDGYFEALKKVKIISKEKLIEVLDFLSSIANIVADLGKEKKKYLHLNEKLEEQIILKTKEQKELLSLFDKGDSVIFKWKNNSQWSIDYVSQNAIKVFGYTADEFISGSIKYIDCIYNDDIDMVTSEVEKNSRENLDFFKHQPYRIVTKDNQIKWVMDDTIIVRDESNAITHYLGYISDITHLKEIEKEKDILIKKIEKIAYKDVLTNIPNRLCVMESFEKALASAKRNNLKVSVIFIDLDGFKILNDTFGHIFGDDILKQTANILKDNLRKDDIYGRIGGDEFIIVSIGAQLYENVEVVCNKILNNIKKIEIEDSLKGSFGASIGAVISSVVDTTTVEELINNSDNMMYEVKKNKKNSYLIKELFL